MKKTMITMMVAAMAATAGIAYADMTVPLYDKASTMEKPFVGSVSAEYSTNYMGRGLVPSSSRNDNAFPLSVMGQYALSNEWSIVAGVQYTLLKDNGFKHGRRDGIVDEGTGILGVRKDWANGVTTTLSYQYVNGGIMNIFHPSTRGGSAREIFNSHQSEEHDIVFDLNYDLTKVGMKGLFWDSRVLYSARWESGWWFTNTLGYKYDLCKRASAVLSASWNVSAGYFDDSALNANGTQGVSLNLDIPIKLCDGFVIKPYVGTVWAGNGAITANHRYGDVYRNFTVVGGVALIYTF